MIRKKIKKHIGLVFAAMLTAASFAAPVAGFAQSPEQKAVYWNGSVLKTGQIGKINVLKSTKLWKWDKNKKAQVVRTLKAGEQYRVYGYDAKDGGLYFLGSGLFVKKQPGFVKYETPSKEKLALVNGHKREQETPKVEPKPFAFTIMHTNDTHAHLDNAARRITAIENIRKKTKHSILLDAGDVFSGTLFFNKYLGQADLQFMNQARYDAMVPGNHEFDKGPKPFADFVKNAKFPIVSSNIVYNKEPELKNLFKGGVGKNAKGGGIYEAIILNVGGEKVGIFGLTTEETAILANPGKNIVFENAKTKAQQAVNLLKKEDVNKIIALSHLGYKYDVELGEQVKGIDVIVGGHSHIKLEEPVALHVKEEPTIIVQANEYSKFLGRVDVYFDEKGVLEDWRGQLIDLDAVDGNKNYVIPSNQKAQALYEELKKPLDEMKAEIVGKTKVFLDGERQNVRTKETNLGNFVADGMLAKAQESTTATIAIQNGGGIRSSINEGNISMGDVLTVMPFANTLVTLELTGAEIIEALENGVSKVEEQAGRFPQVAGMKFTYDPKKPAGSRIVDVQVKTDKGFAPIDKTAKYIVATNAYMADGGDGYTVFKKAKEEGRMTELFIPDYQVFIDYLQKFDAVEPKGEGRINIVQ